MADIVLSINPRHSQAILEGRKTAELRRRKPAKPVGRVVVYETSPTRMIVGEFTVPSIIEAPPAELWDLVGNRARVTREEFDEYFGARSRKGARKGKPCAMGYAFEVGVVTRYEIDPRKADPFWTSPQSFILLTHELRRAIDTRNDAPWLTLDEIRG